MRAVRRYYETLGEDFVNSLICNTDRHFGNFGVLVDSRENCIIKPAPLFDHGNSLFNLAGDENWRSEQDRKSTRLNSSHTDLSRMPYH